MAIAALTLLGMVVAFVAGAWWMRARLRRQWRNSDVARRIEAIRQQQTTHHFGSSSEGQITRPDGQS